MRAHTIPTTTKFSWYRPMTKAIGQVARRFWRWA